MAMAVEVAIWVARMVWVGLSGWISSCLTVADEVASSLRSGDLGPFHFSSHDFVMTSLFAPKSNHLVLRLLSAGSLISSLLNMTIIVHHVDRSNEHRLQDDSLAIETQDLTEAFEIDFTMQILDQLDHDMTVVCVAVVSSNNAVIP
ncbi:hypothetical protein RIF29_39271 [Crotalaria pallida]|uniref:Uncharacterized protein n=1 Tax=Crotalaria pallida TaxID=3830 RepID=A0AAN9E1E0_CROPI